MSIELAGALAMQAALNGLKDVEGESARGFFTSQLFLLHSLWGYSHYV